LAQRDFLGEPGKGAELWEMETLDEAENRRGKPEEGGVLQKCNSLADLLTPRSPPKSTRPDVGHANHHLLPLMARGEG
jgi:hypothetical protein